MLILKHKKFTVVTTIFSTVKMMWTYYLIINKLSYLRERERERERRERENSEQQNKTTHLPIQLYL